MLCSYLSTFWGDFVIILQAIYYISNKIFIFRVHCSLLYHFLCKLLPSRKNLMMRTIGIHARYKYIASKAAEFGGPQIFSYIMKYKIQHYANNCFILWLGRWCLLDATSNVLPGWYSSPRSTVRQGKHWTHRLEVPGRIINGVRGYSWRSRSNQFKTNRRTGNAYVNQTNVGFKRGSKGTIHLETKYVLWGRVN